MKSYLRQRIVGEAARVDFAELFFDLVFVFAVTQVSHTLLAHLNWQGALQAVVVLFAMWWVWNYTAWATNWLDPTHPLIRLMLFVLMLAGLVFSTSIPEAFGERGLLFALAYVLMQVGRCLFTAWAVRVDAPENARNFLRITSWQVFGGIFWIAGAFLPADQRLVVWAIAVLIEFASPSLSFWTPWLGKTALNELDVEGGHMAERSGLFIIIALGESILVTGATFAESHFDTLSVAAFVVAFIGSVAMWWIYFNNSAEGHHVPDHADPAITKRTSDLARVGYTYFHMVIVGGIIATAVGDELVLAHPTGHPAELGAVLTIVGGPLLYLLGTGLFQGFLRQRWPLPTTVAVILLAGLCLVGGSFEPLPLAAITAALLVALAAWETFADTRPAALPV
ncbi:MAG: low temperature requirement protein A [Devosia sp.]